MNESKSYFIIKNPKDNSGPIEENELVCNINELFQDGRISQIPIDIVIGKGYSYQDVQSMLEIDGYLNVLQVTSQQITENGKDTHTVNNSVFSSFDNRDFLDQDSDVAMDEVYVNALTKTLIETIKEHKDLTDPLSALQEYNELTQPQKDLEQNIKNSL